MLKLKCSVYLSLAVDRREGSVSIHGADFPRVCVVGSSYDRDKVALVGESALCVWGSGTDTGADSESAEFSSYGTAVVCESLDAPLESFYEARWVAEAYIMVVVVTSLSD